ncbi:MAG: tetratricopeptide repeat protein [Alteromonadaceae bacterium]|nr:tetratricopeptide repeat protein [Alteromonadaceae bacterium]
MQRFTLLLLYSTLLLTAIGFSSVSFAKQTNDTYTLVSRDSAQIKNAVALYHKNKFKAAKTLFLQILKADQKSLDSLVYLTRINAKQKNFDDAEGHIKIALKLAPNNAYVQNLSGKIYAAIAQRASIFSALGYAKKCLKGFRTAVELSPKNIDYQQMLISYYIGAPGIAGGNEELAMQHAQAINKLDIKQGYIAIGKVLLAQENDKALAQHLANTPTNIQNDAEVLLGKGFIYQKQKDYPQALVYFQRAAKNAINSDEETRTIKYQSLYQLGKTSDISKQQLNQGIAALTQFIDQAPSGDQLASKEWAQFRLANLIAKQGDKSKAKSLYQLVAKNTKDENLKDKVEDLL